MSYGRTLDVCAVWVEVLRGALAVPTAANSRKTTCRRAINSGAQNYVTVSCRTALRMTDCTRGYDAKLT